MSIHVSVITLSLRLPKSSNPNAKGRGGHWSKRAKAQKEDRAMAEMETRAALRHLAAPRWPRAVIVATWYAKHERFIPDEGNAHARMKAYIDGIADAGLFVNDKFVTTTLHRDIDRKVPRLVLLIQESK